MKRDNVFRGFLQRQQKAATELTAASSLVSVTPAAVANSIVADSDCELPRHYLAEFRCTGLIRSPGGEVAEADRFLVGVYFPDHYLQSASSFETLVWLAPREIFHPNIAAPLVCCGEAFMRRAPGIVEIAYQLFAMISWSRYAAHDALSPAAAQWARSNLHRFPVDRRPLKARRLDVAFVEAAAAPETCEKGGLS
jgi:hypothetical protein